MGTTDDGRAYPRVRADDGTGWDVEIHTYDPDGVRIDLRGTASSLSRSGVLIRIRHEVEVGTGCLVHFLDAGETITPAYAIGRIVRVDPVADGADVAIHFEKPLDRIGRPE